MSEEYGDPFFGEKWDAPATDAAPQVSTPIGEHCQMCDREIYLGDQGWIRTTVLRGGNGLIQKQVPIHRGCELGTTIGHMFGFCSCTGWDDIYERGQALLEHLDRMAP